MGFSANQSGEPDCRLFSTWTKWICCSVVALTGWIQTGDTFAGRVCEELLVRGLRWLGPSSDRLTLWKSFRASCVSGWHVPSTTQDDNCVLGSVFDWWRGFRNSTACGRSNQWDETLIQSFHFFELCRNDPVTFGSGSIQVSYFGCGSILFFLQNSRKHLFFLQTHAANRFRLVFLYLQNGETRQTSETWRCFQGPGVGFLPLPSLMVVSFKLISLRLGSKFGLKWLDSTIYDCCY